MKHWLLVLFSCVMIQTAVAVEIDDLTFVTEEYPPVNFQQDGRLQGISVDMLEAMLIHLNAEARREDIQYLPWARGYEMVQRLPNTVLFATTRTDAREKLFKWVGPIVLSRNVLLARRDSELSVSSIDDLNGQALQIAVIREDVAEQLLLEYGTEPDLVRWVASNDSAARMLHAGRIDLWAYGEDVALWRMRELGYETEEFEVVHVLDESPLYYALHPDTPDEIVNSLQGALDQLRESGEVEKILARYR
ncbi:substrate-binding periplasmic protein [Nitrincola sp. MINF-07-Sa-05]|uniref:substrate-binding periplasmic protein n=1 Tax=Nitrincola salilacus TaxID=3400273 RepID=UPI003917D453